MGSKIIQMRDVFLNKLYELAVNDKNIILITDDLDAPILKKFKQLDNQYINIGIAEQNMINVATGLSLKGKIVYVYAIAPFATLRCLEQIKVNLCLMNLPVTILGTGSGFAYNIAGPTHHATEDIAIMNAIPGMTIYNPSDNIMVEALVDISYKKSGPKYIRFDRLEAPNLYNKLDTFTSGMTKINHMLHEDICIITTGMMVHKSFEIIRTLLFNHNINCSIIDLYRIKPINEKHILCFIEQSEAIMTIEEHQIHGGIGSIIGSLLAENNINKPFKRIAIQDKYCTDFGTREYLQEINNLDTNSIIEQITKWKETLK